MVVVGTRADAIKLSPVVRALRKRPDIEPLLLSTGQHREMLDEVLELFALTPDADLALMEEGQTLSGLNQRVLAGISEAIEDCRPDAVVVQGDTTTSMAAALASFYARVPVVHVEAGLRSGSVDQPFPEEANRRLTGIVTGLHLAPTAGAAANLRREGIDHSTIVITGNPVIDALFWVNELPRAAPAPAVAALAAETRRIVVVTAHRRESWGLPLFRVGLGLAEVARAHPDALLVVPAHRNPTVRESLLSPFEGLANVIVTEPLDYLSFTRLMAQSHVVVTDSGVIQEEAPALGKPVLVLRDRTERPEGVEAGTARLVGTRVEGIIEALDELLCDDLAYRRMLNVANPYGDGHAARRTADAVAYLLGLGARPAHFRLGNVRRGTPVSV